MKVERTTDLFKFDCNITHSFLLITYALHLTTLAKLKLDLHEIFNKGVKIDQALNDIIDEAIERRVPIVEIIPGKGSGQLKKKVIRFLEQKHIKAKYHRIDKDSKNFGRLFVRFKH
ncbi:MAG: DNA-nicking Smr family endonuclease [Bacteroidia bacterium]|jgi:DNA-nicking Smr family endonuclease